MLVTITLIELRNPFKFFPLSYTALGIIKQLKEVKCLANKNTGIWTTHYTMTLWESAEQMHGFAHSGAHLEAMKKSGKLAKEIRTLTYEATELPDWKTAKARIMTEGKVMRF
jgi:hypothetical protein